MPGPYGYGEGMMHEGMEEMEGMDMMATCPCNANNVYPCHSQTPPMVALGYAQQCREYAEVAETEPLKISGATRSGA